MIVKSDLKKISDYIWEIPRSFRSDMRVPARVFASEKLLDEIFRDRSLEQLANVATLPGIQKHALAMPDAHEGYGFCLSEDAKIMSEFGYRRIMKDLEKQWKSERVRVLDYDSRIFHKAGIENFFKIKPRGKIFKVITKSGQSIIATGDHPFYTPAGMKAIKNIKAGSSVAIFGFEGVTYEKPPKQIIVNEKDIRKTIVNLGAEEKSHRFNIIIRKLKERGLLGIGYNHSKFPYLIKIAAFIFGDGTMNFIGKRGDGIISFSGKIKDLEDVKKDLAKIGYTSSPIYERRHKMKSGEDSINYSFAVNASSLLVLLRALGVPLGKKVNQPYLLPKWIFKAPLWQKRLFLAALFGCELRMPHRRLNRRGNFNAPVFPMNKSEELLKNGERFLKDIAKLLSEFQIKVAKLNRRRRHIAKDGIISFALELIISSKADNLINLWGKIGFEYNQKRSFLASAAVRYLKLKQKFLQEKEEAIAVKIPELLKQGLPFNQIARRLAGDALSDRFIKDVCRKIARSRKNIVPRVPPSFPTFSEYLESAAKDLGLSGLVWEKVIKIEEIRFKDYVYDFRVSHQSHNFVADNFLVSNCIGGVAAMDVEEGVISPGGIGYDINCGVRLLRSPAKWFDAKERMEDLAEEIFKTVPSGLGEGGKLKLADAELDKVLKGGAAEIVNRGFGEKEDLLHIEAGGRLEPAEPSLVSGQAKSRGRDQVGTLGSGNHFLEVQRVDEIFDGEAASASGLFKDQLVVLIHTGSRGLGHQIATDYIRLMMKAMPRYGIVLPDRELACVPFKSKEGRDYFKAMCAGANFAWANRQMLTHLARAAFEKIFGRDFELKTVYDVAHNIAKIEEYEINGAKKKVAVHRKGATRAFGPGNPELPEDYRKSGQPVFIPGSMGTASYVLAGTKESADLAFSTSCHGAGRRMSRHGALKIWRGGELQKDLAKRGIIVKTASLRGVAEEAPLAYKDVEEVVGVVHNAGLAKKVARLKPLAVIKG